jgi:hypothetical protein
VTEHRDFEDTRASILAHELAADTREGALETRAAEVADMERLLGEAQKVWDFLGQAESALVSFGFSPLQSEVLA